MSNSSMETNKPLSKMDLNDETMEYKLGYNSKSKKRKFECEDSDNEQRRLTANSQERIRMQKINSALEDLKRCLPEQFHLHHRRMSKIRALRCAMMYIRNLSQLIHEDNIRRQAQYMQAMDYMRSMFDPRFSGYRLPQEVRAVDETSQTQTTGMPYYPYLGPVCADANSVTPMCQTPVQNPPMHMYEPRPLDFSVVPLKQEISSSNTDHDTDVVITGITETPIKPKYHILPRPRRYSASATPLSSRMLSNKSETIISPLLGLRNDNELNISFLSVNSDQAREENEECRRPSSTLSDIVIGPLMD